MYGPSGFFADIPEDDSIVSGDLELFRDSPEGFTVLYRCQRSGRFFIYKALKPGYRGLRIYEDMLRKDFEIGFYLQHPNVCQYFAFVNHPSAGNCIVMEWIDGEDLGHFLERNGRLSIEVTDRILTGICDALAYIHRKQVIHRDLKPENIMVTFNGLHPKLIDFGLSDADSFAVLKMAAGTQHYASPELLAGDSVDNRTDIWSLGIIMQGLGRRYRHIAARCLRRNPAQRYPDAEAISADIAGLGKGRGAWLGITAAVLILAIAGFLVRERFPGVADTAVHQADSLALDDGADTSVLNVGMASAADGAAGHVTNIASGAAPSSSSAGPASANVAGTRPSGPSAGENRTSLDSTALDALFREAADELGVGE